MKGALVIYWWQQTLPNYKSQGNFPLWHFYLAQIMWSGLHTKCTGLWGPSYGQRYGIRCAFISWEEWSEEEGALH